MVTYYPGLIYSRFNLIRYTSYFYNAGEQEECTSSTGKLLRTYAIVTISGWCVSAKGLLLCREFFCYVTYLTRKMCQLRKFYYYNIFFIYSLFTLHISFFKLYLLHHCIKLINYDSTSFAYYLL